MYQQHSRLLHHCQVHPHELSGPVGWSRDDGVAGPEGRGTAGQAGDAGHYGH